MAAYLLGMQVKLHPEILIDQEDLVKLSIYTAWIAKGKKDYVQLRYEGKKQQLHRVIMGLPDCQVDHKNGNGLDCRKENLRLATNQENSFNSQIGINNTSGYKGVSWSKAANKWEARIMLNRKSHYIGLYDTKEKAAAAYNRKAKEFFKEFACLNKIEEVCQ